MRTSDVAYISNRYPLVERLLDRQGCFAWLRWHGFPVPPKSTCLGCPYHIDLTCRTLRDRDPAEWEETVAFDCAIRRGLPWVKGQAFLHRTMIPVERVDLRTATDRGQPTLTGFDEECSGHCGV